MRDLIISILALLTLTTPVMAQPYVGLGTGISSNNMEFHGVAGLEWDNDIRAEVQHSYVDYGDRASTHESSLMAFYDFNRLPLEPYVGLGVSYKQERFFEDRRHLRHWFTPAAQIGIRPQVSDNWIVDMGLHYSDSQQDFVDRVAEDKFQARVSLIHRF